MSATVLSRLLRDPADIASCCREDRDVRAIAVTSLLSIVAGAAAFGGVIGSFRGGAQIAYGALKVPLAVIATLAVCAPAFHALCAGLGRAWPMRSIIALSLASAGRSALVLLALSPALWLLFDRGLGYHSAALAASFAYAIAGLAALGILVRGLGEGPGRALTAVAFVGVFFAVGGQTSWILRPYLVRPRTVDVPFVRAREGSFADALYMSTRSSMDIYDVAATRSMAVPAAVRAMPEDDANVARPVTDVPSIPRGAEGLRIPARESYPSMRDGMTPEERLREQERERALDRADEARPR